MRTYILCKTEIAVPFAQKSFTIEDGFILTSVGFSCHPVSCIFQIYFKDFVLGPTISTKFPSGSFNIKRQMS